VLGELVGDLHARVADADDQDVTGGQLRRVAVPAAVYLHDVR
jgi:hypothetical protein